MLNERCVECLLPLSVDEAMTAQIDRQIIPIPLHRRNNNKTLTTQRAPIQTKTGHMVLLRDSLTSPVSNYPA